MDIKNRNKTRKMCFAMVRRNQLNSLSMENPITIHWSSLVLLNHLSGEPTLRLSLVPLNYLFGEPIHYLFLVMLPSPYVDSVLSINVLKPIKLDSMFGASSWTDLLLLEKNSIGSKIYWLEYDMTCYLYPCQ